MIKKKDAFEQIKIPQWRGRIFFYQQLSSTNTTLLEGLKEKLFTGYDVVWAHSQSEGRGRSGRKWISPGEQDGKALLFSLAIPFPEKTEKTNWEKKASLPQVAAWTWCRIFQQAGAKVTLKWPNDILFQEKKLAGILAETLVQMDNFMVIGMGINLKLSPAFTKKLEADTGRLVTSLDQGLPEENKLLDPHYALSVFLSEFAPLIELWRDRGFAPFVQSWKEQSDLIGRRVIISNPGGSREEVTVEDLDDQGFLVVRGLAGEGGEQKTISFGEIEY